MTGAEFGALTALGAIVFLDQWPAVQTMISRPIVVGPIVGAVLGAPADGVLWGAVLETIALAVQPVGAARYPDAALAGLLGTAAALTGFHEGLFPAGWAVVVAVTAGAAGDAVGRLQRRWNGRTAARVRARVAAGSLAAPGRGIAVALSRAAALGALQTALGLGIVLAGVAILGSSAWAGWLDARALQVAAAAMAAVGGVRVLGLEGRRSAAAAAGALAGFALIAWGGP